MWPSILWTDALKDVPRCLEIEAWNHGTAHPLILTALRHINQLVAEMSGRAPLPGVGVDQPALRALLRECGYTQAQENQLTLQEIIAELEGLAITRQLISAPGLMVSPVTDAVAAIERTPVQVVENGKATDDKDWMLVTHALKQLPFLRNLKALYQYAEENPQKLKVRQLNKRRKQVRRADVQQLAEEYENQDLEKLDTPVADNLPPISGDNLQKLAKRMAREQDRKRNQK